VYRSVAVGVYFYCFSLFGAIFKTIESARDKLLLLFKRMVSLTVRDWQGGAGYGPGAYPRSIGVLNGGAWQCIVTNRTILRFLMKRVCKRKLSRR